MRDILPRRWQSRRARSQLPAVQSPQTAGDLADGPTEGARVKTLRTSVHRISSWPEEARPLKEKAWISYLFLLGDIVLVLTPIFFILLGIAAILLHRKPTKGNAFGSKVEVATQLGPTIFPIVFAAISGRSMKMIARFLAERGAKLGTLELLMASQSVWGTFESQLLMRRLTVVGAHLLFLWSLSPLGGQASLRILGKTDKADYTQAKLRYLTTGPAGTMWGMETSYSANGEFADADALYSAALLAPVATKLGPRDTWGNVKIPSLSSLDGLPADADGWLTIPKNISAPEQFSSLMGLPVVGRSDNRDSNFSLESTYLSVDCRPFERRVPFPWVGGDVDLNVAQTFLPGQIKLNSTYDFTQNNFTAPLFLQTDLPFYDGSDPDTPESSIAAARFNGFTGFNNGSALNDPAFTKQRTITVGSVFVVNPDQLQFGINLANCSLTQEHVEAYIECIQADCAAQKIRKSRTDTRSQASTGLEHQLIAQQFLTKLPVGVSRGMGSTPTELFLLNTSSFPYVQVTGNADTIGRGWVDLSNLTTDVFSRRLSLVLNTYYQVSMGPTGYFGSLPQNLSLYGPDCLPAKDIDAWLPSNLSASDHAFAEWWPDFTDAVQAREEGLPFIGATTTATEATHYEVFVCSFAWLALLLAASVVLLVTGIASLILKRKTLGPELFGFVTSMTYENPYVRIPNGGSALDAMERARLLKDMRVYVGDVQGDREVGHVAFAAGSAVRGLERGRLYA